jgi:hypothetical protein
MSGPSLSSTIDRRSFLRMGSTAALGVAALALTEPKLFAAAAGARDPRPLNPVMLVGFAPALPATGESVRLSAADALLLPDPAFIARGARISVAGSARRRVDQGRFGGLAIDAVFPIESRRPESYPRFRFWAVTSREDNGEGVSGPVSFVMTVPATSGLTFLAERTMPVESEPSAKAPPLGADVGRFTLSLLNGGGPKLQRGVYVIALRESNDQVLTDWSRFSVVNDHQQYSITGDAFSYVILNIDYAQ